MMEALDALAIHCGHHDLLDTLHELLADVERPEGLDEEGLRAALAFLRQGLVPFARREERALGATGEARESAAFEHAFLEAEIDRLDREAGPLLRSGPPVREEEREEATARVRRTLCRVAAVLELHVLKEDERVSRTSPPPGARACTVRERVQWSDMDAAGIVCHGRYLRFFERAESELFRTAGLPARILSDVHHMWLVRRRVECDFLQPVSCDEELEISASVGSIGRSSLEMRFLAGRSGETGLAATGHYVLVAVDRESMRPRPLPQAVRAALRPFRLHEGSVEEVGR